MKQTAINFVLQHEGGYSNHPDDDGGETMYGISSRFFPAFEGTLDGARRIYSDRFWEKYRLDEVPDALALVLFDGFVNQGPQRLIKKLQALVNTAPDGIIGPMTLAGIRSLPTDYLVSEMIAYRMWLYGSHKDFLIFGKGWTRRLAECHQLACEHLEI